MISPTVHIVFGVQIACITSPGLLGMYSVNVTVEGNDGAEGGGMWGFQHTGDLRKSTIPSEAEQHQHVLWILQVVTWY